MQSIVISLQITGLFRSAAAGSLDSWHLAQDFATLPTLNGQFIVEDAPMARIKAVTDQPDFLFDCFFLVIYVQDQCLSIQYQVL